MIGLGSDVLVGGDIPAKVLAVTVGEGYVAYKCSWWHEGQHYVDWISDLEVSRTSAQSQRQTIKFNRD